VGRFGDRQPERDVRRAARRGDRQQQDGNFTSNLGGQPGTGSFRVVDGKAVYEGANMRGTATLHGTGKDRVLKGEGTWVGSPGQSSFELRRR
jgi:hypothetical protein